MDLVECDGALSTGCSTVFKRGRRFGHGCAMVKGSICEGRGPSGWMIRPQVQESVAGPRHRWYMCLNPAYPETH
jgi:hypothetical protein